MPNLSARSELAMQSQSLRACFVSLILLATSSLFAAGGTDVIATKGQPVAESPTWPAGVAAIINDPTRTTGWKDWFSEWPNDVNQYAFEIASTDDLNRLLEKLAATKAEVRQVRLSFLKEPDGLGWVTSAPKGNNIAAVFSLGDQTRIDEWYKRVRKPFGKMEFTAAPVAVPPTLTIFVQNKAVNLEQLKIPKGINVSSGYVPRVFHQFNTKDEQKRKDDAAQKPVAVEKLDPDAQAAADKIEALIGHREAQQAIESKQEAWSEPVNGLSGRLLLTLEELKIAEAAPSHRYKVILEVKNDTGQQIAFRSQPEFVDVVIRDANGKELPDQGHEMSGPVPLPQWAVIPGQSYLGLRVDMQTVGLPGGTALVGVGGYVRFLKPGKHTLTATIVAKQQEGPKNQWLGKMKLPPVSVTFRGPAE